MIRGWDFLDIELLFCVDGDVLHVVFELDVCFFFLLSGMSAIIFRLFMLFIEHER